MSFFVGSVRIVYLSYYMMARKHKAGLAFRFRIRMHAYALSIRVRVRRYVRPYVAGVVAGATVVV